MIWIQGTSFGNWVKPDWSLQTHTTPCWSQDWFDRSSTPFVMKTAALLVWCYFLGEIITEAGKTSSTRNYKSSQLLGPAGRKHVRRMTAQGHASHCRFPPTMVLHPPQEGTEQSRHTWVVLGPSARHVISGLMIWTYRNGTGTAALHRSAIAPCYAQKPPGSDLDNKKSQWIALLAPVLSGPLNGLAQNLIAVPCV